MAKRRPGPRDSRTVTTVMDEAKKRQAARDATVDAAPRSVFIPPALSAGGRPSPAHDDHARDTYAKTHPKRNDVDEVFRLALARPARVQLSQQPDTNVSGAPVNPGGERLMDTKIRHLKEQRGPVTFPLETAANAALKWGQGLAADAGWNAAEQLRHPFRQPNDPMYEAAYKKHEMRQAGLLPPEVVSGIPGLVGNFVEGSTNAAVGLVPGLFLMGVHPKTFAKEAWKDAKYHLSPTDFSSKLYNDPEWYVFSAWGLANVPKNAAAVAARLRGKAQEVPLGYTLTDSGPVRRQVSGSPLTQMVQSWATRWSEENLPAGTPLVGANKRAGKQLSVDDENDQARMMAPIFEFAHHARYVIRSPFRRVAYDRLARFGGSPEQAIHSIEDEIAWRKETGGLSNRTLIVQLQGGLRVIRKGDQRVFALVDRGREITKAAQDIFIKYHMLSEEAAAERLHLPAKAVFQLPDIDSPVREAYKRELAALPEFIHNEPLLAAVMDVLDTYAYNWWQHERARTDRPESSPGGRTKEDAAARITELEGFLQPYLKQIYDYLRAASPTPTIGRDRRPRRVMTDADRAKTHAIGVGDPVEVRGVINARSSERAKAADMQRAEQILAEKARASTDPIMRKLTKAIEELDDLRLAVERNTDPEVVFGDQPAPGYGRPPVSSPPNPADFYERYLHKPVHDGIPEGALHQEVQLEPGMVYEYNGATWRIIDPWTDAGVLVESVGSGIGTQTYVGHAWLQQHLRPEREPPVSAQSSPGVHPLEGFRSKLMDTIVAKMPDKASGEQILGILKSADVKEDEIKWSGLKEFLAGARANPHRPGQVALRDHSRIGMLADEPPKKSYSKDEVIAWLDKNSLQVEERVADKTGYGDTHDENTKFGSYTLPGGQEAAYREILIRLPEERYGALYHYSNHFPDTNILVHLRTTERMVDGKKTVFVEEIQSDWQQAGQKRGFNDPNAPNPEAEQAHAAYLTETARLNELIDGMAFQRDHVHGLPFETDVLGSFQSTRDLLDDIDAKFEIELLPYGQVAVNKWVAHDRYVEPIKKDYRVFDSRERAEQYAAQERKTRDDLPRDYKPEMHKVLQKLKQAIPIRDRAEAHYHDYRRFKRMAEEGVADAPMQKTWQELAIKRALAWAVDNGFEQIAWTTGKTQSERYSLANFYSRIEIEEKPAKSSDDYRAEAQTYWDENLADNERARHESEFADYWQYDEPRPDESDFKTQEAFDAAEEEWIQASDEARWEAESEAWVEYERERVHDLANELENNDDSTDGYTIHTVDKDGNTDETQVDAEENELSDYVGVDIAAAYHNGQTVFEGNDLAMGDNVKSALAQQVFYDKRIVNFVDKYLKKHGAKVQRKEIDGGGRIDTKVITHDIDHETPYVVDTGDGPNNAMFEDWFNAINYSTISNDLPLPIFRERHIPSMDMYQAASDLAHDRERWTHPNSEPGHRTDLWIEAQIDAEAMGRGNWQGTGRMTRLDNGEYLDLIGPFHDLDEAKQHVINLIARNGDRAANEQAGGTVVHALHLNDDVVKFVQAGQPLFQKGRPPGRFDDPDAPVPPRGAASKEHGQVTMHFGESSDASTAPHEGMHAVRLAIWDELPLEITRPIEASIGVRNGRWTKKHEETLARSLELQLRTGKAPSPKVRSAYRKLGKELKLIYHSPRSLGKKENLLRDDPDFMRALKQLIDPTYSVGAKPGAFYIGDTVKRPVLGTRPKWAGSKNRDRFYEDTGFLFEQGKLRAGPKLTLEHTTRAARIAHQAETADFINERYAEPIEIGEPLKKGYTFFNPEGAKIPRHMKEVDEGREMVERMEGIGPDDLDEAMQAEIKALQDLIFPDEKTAALSTGPLKQVPQWIKDAYVSELHFTVPGASILKYAAGVLKFANNLARLGLIYLSPAYIPVNFTANEILAIIQQGVFHPVNMARALGHMSDLTRPTLRRIDVEVSGGGARALSGDGRGITGAVTQSIAEFMNRGADVIPRRTAMIHELWKYGYRTDEAINALFDSAVGSLERDKLNQISQQANEAMVRFDGLSPEEKQVISQGIFIYRWVKGATRYAVRLPLDHPVATMPLYEIGNIGYQELEARRGKVIGRFFRGKLPYGEKYKDALGTTLLKVLDFNSLSPVTTGLEAWEAVYGSLTGKGIARVADMFSPPLDIGLQVATGRDNQGNALQGNPFLTALQREAKGYKVVRTTGGLISGSKESRYYGKESRWDVAQRSLTGIWPPRPLKLNEAIDKGYEEMPTRERYLTKMKAGDPDYTPFKVTQKLIVRQAKKRFPYDSQKTKRQEWTAIAKFLSSPDSDYDRSFAGTNALLKEYGHAPISQKTYDEISRFAKETKAAVGG